MLHSKSWYAAGVLATIAAGLLCPSLAHAFEAGAAKTEITPELGVPLNGYLARMGRGAIEVRDPLWARALYLDDGETRVLLVNVDLCVINTELRTRVLELAPPDVPREHIILTATHTHNGHGGMVESLIFRPISGPYLPGLVEVTAHRIVEAMEQAIASKQRATIGYSTATQRTLSRNRRIDGGPIDEQVGVVRVDDADGNMISVVGNFAAHPTTVPSEDGLSFSADYCGFFYNELEALSPAGCVALFLNGAEGDQSCATTGNRSGWAQAEWVGEQLAALVKAEANQIIGEEATLRVGYATPTLPLTMGASFMPARTVVQTLEIDGLLMSFFPGEPCVEIGLELRRRALARGYEAHFSVGLANDHLLYFAPRAWYHEQHYETAMSLYGPYIEEWLYRQFEMLMTRGEPPPEPPAILPPEVSERGGALTVQLRGEPRALGVQRGRAFQSILQDAFEKRVVEMLRSPEYQQELELLPPLPWFVDITPLLLPLYGISARPLLDGLPEPLFRETAGLAEGAGIPFDAAWLLQCLQEYAAQPGAAPDDFYRLPFCTIAAVVGDRAGADDILVGRTLDWPQDDAPVVALTAPDSGYRFIEAGFAWAAGTYSAMNERGLTVAVERVEAQGAPSLDGPPVALALRHVVQTAATVAEARQILEAFTHLAGYHVLLADAGPEALVLELGSQRAVRRPENGILLGSNPEAESTSDDARSRYQRLHTLLVNERIVSPEELESFMSDRRTGVEGRHNIYNEDTLYRIVFEPKARRVRAAAGNAEAFEIWSFEGGAP